MNSDTDIDVETLNLIQNLIIQNKDLEKLESLLDRFNIFEALGAVRQEVRHSDFLAFLLNPRQTHGLGDLFVKRLLQEAIAQADYFHPIRPIDLDLWDLDDVEIRREWQSIDVLILDDLHKFAVIIENKIYSGEHSNQLTRYLQLIKQQYPNYRIFGLFLTPEGESPSNPAYIAISYGLICRLVEDILNTRESNLGRDVFVLMRHYDEMLRRYIVGESEIEKLCQQIYRKHQRALDLIYEYRPDQQAMIKDHLVELIESASNLELDRASKSYFYFIPKKWDLPILKNGQGWTRSGRMLLFQFTNLQDVLKLSLILGPGPDEPRQELFELVRQNEPPFKRSFKALGRMYSTIYNRNFLTQSNYQEKTTEELRKDIELRWNEFLEHELPKLNELLASKIEQMETKSV